MVRCRPWYAVWMGPVRVPRHQKDGPQVSVHTPEKLHSLDGRTFFSESEEAFCVWSAACPPGAESCEYAIEVFTRAGKLWKRSSEEHREYVHEPQWLRKILLEAGFGEVRVCGGLPLRERRAEDERLFFVASLEAAKN